jgi:hypothetical protein
MTWNNIRLLIFSLNIIAVSGLMACNADHSSRKKFMDSSVEKVLADSTETSGEYPSVYALLVSPKNPMPGEPFRIVAVGGKDILKALISITGPDGALKSDKRKTGDEFPYWRIDDYTGGSAGEYNVTLSAGDMILSTLDFTVSPAVKTTQSGAVWKTVRGWDRATEAVYSAWINFLFHGCSENASWTALHEVTQNPEQNFLYNYLSLGEDDPDGDMRVIMQPDCADNPFFLRAYFAWKLGLPFGYHVCDRGSPGRNPGTGQWISNAIPATKADPVAAFNAFLRKVMDGVHSGTARTALDNVNSDYYPVALERTSLLPGTVFADPYGHTLIITGWVPQTNNHPGLLLSVDAQPDGTIGIKRFWKGNFLFSTSEVIGEPGFKAFRPISSENGVTRQVPLDALTDSSGFTPFSLQQRKMGTEVFYHTMERLINPEPLDPETALTGLIQSLHEQLMVRVTSVANSEAYYKLHPGTVIPMPSGTSGIFQAGGLWEAYSTPNRDLRLLIAMDAVLGFPDQAARSPEDFNFPAATTPDQIREKLQLILDKKASELSVSYIRTDGSTQQLTVRELLDRIDAFEMAYNPNDGVEIRWGAPEGSAEIATCRRHAPPDQVARMRSVRSWFVKRLHPPT